MNILFDTNIIIDFFLKREPFAVEARELFSLAVDGLFEGFITANAVSDIFYLIHKKLSYTDTKQCLVDLMELLKVLPVTEADCWEAINSPNPDFEDALMEICSNKVRINYIVTRDIKFIDFCPIAINPANLINLLK